MNEYTLENLKLQTRETIDRYLARASRTELINLYRSIGGGRPPLLGAELRNLIRFYWAELPKSEKVSSSYGSSRSPSRYSPSRYSPSRYSPSRYSPSRNMSSSRNMSPSRNRTRDELQGIFRY